MLGIECGGSDASGFGANPAVGNLSDRLVDLGASTMMSETIEFVGAEHILARRGATKEIHDQIIRSAGIAKPIWQPPVKTAATASPRPATRRVASPRLRRNLGCIYKGGTRPIVVVMEGERPTKKGAIVMDSPGYDIASVTAMVAGGCQVVVFTTGRGTPTGHALAPVLKVTANRATYLNMIDNMDIDASGVTEGEVALRRPVPPCWTRYWRFATERPPRLNPMASPIYRHRPHLPVHLIGPGTRSLAHRLRLASALRPRADTDKRSMIHMSEKWRNENWFTSSWNFAEEVRSSLHFSDHIKIHDVTLRDGEQQAGLIFDYKQKIALAEKLSEMGIHRIEAGMPAVSAQDQQVIVDLAKRSDIKRDLRRSVYVS